MSLKDLIGFLKKKLSSFNLVKDQHFESATMESSEMIINMVGKVLAELNSDLKGIENINPRNIYLRRKLMQDLLVEVRSY